MKKKRKPVRRSKRRLILLVLLVLVVGWGSDIVSGLTPERLERVFFIRDSVMAKQKPNFVPFDKIPLNVKQAIVSVEDGRFYSHFGFDIAGIARAAFVNVQSGEIEEGASTITQQVIKNLFLSSEQTMGRKIEELILAVDMEQNFTKEEILELYLNTIYFGSDFYGIGEASVGYFGKQPLELNLAEAAMLAGLPNAPSLYSPYVDFMLAKKRQFIVLDAMERSGYITAQAAEAAKTQPIYLARGKN